MTPQQIADELRRVQTTLASLHIVLGGVPKQAWTREASAVYDGSFPVIESLPALIAAVEAQEQLLNTVLVAWGRHLGGWDESKATPLDVVAYKYLHGEGVGDATQR